MIVLMRWVSAPVARLIDMATKRSPKKLIKASTKPLDALPATYRGAKVVRGKGTHHAKMDRIRGRYALVSYQADKTVYLVVDDSGLDSGLNELKLFDDYAIAEQYAQGLSYGNVDHRVLTITAQTLVVATDNDL